MHPFLATARRIPNTCGVRPQRERAGKLFNMTPKLKIPKGWRRLRYGAIPKRGDRIRIGYGPWQAIPCDQTYKIGPLHFPVIRKVCAG